MLVYEYSSTRRHCRHLEPIFQKNKITWKLSPTPSRHQKNPLTVFDKQSSHFYKDISFPLAYKTKQGLISISYLPSLIFFCLIVTRFPCENKRQKLAQNSFLSQWNVCISLIRFTERNKGFVYNYNAADLWGTFQVDVNEPTVDLRFWLAPPPGTPPRNKDNGHWWPNKRLQVLTHRGFHIRSG